VQILTPSARPESISAPGLLLRLEVLDSLFAGVVIYGLDGTVLEANRTPIEGIGLRREDVIGKPGWDTFWWSHSVESQSRVREALRRSAAGEKVRDDYLVRTGENRLSTIDTMFRPLRARDGRIECIISSGVDVSARERAEQALEEKSEVLSSILSISPEAVVIADQDLRVLVFSEGAKEIFGYQPEEMIGSSIDRLIPERYRHAHAHHVDEFSSGGAMSKRMGERGELRGVRKNGEEFPAEASLSRLMTAHGLIYAVALRDISRQNAAREELLAAKRAAEGANEAKSRFIANMSHELRTPLNAIIGFSELMMGQCFGPLGDPRYREYAADIRKSGEHLLSLINEILDISRIEAGRIELNEEAPLEVAELIDHCTRWIAARAIDAGIGLRTEIASETPALRGDPRLLTQILLNVISNALKFTPAGGLVTVRAGVAASGGVEIAVADTGIGMSPQQLARIGEPFVQFDDDKGRKGEGTGLGVSIAKRLAELHGGELTIESAAGRGTIAILRLPQARSMARPSPRAAALAS
jgi:PAS domain S-box-containing protein